MKILITGVSGFIGKKVLEKLQKKYSPKDIIVISSNKIENIKTILAKGYEFDDGYLCQNGCEDVETIIHIGAFIPKAAVEANDVTKSCKNINSTEKILVSKLPNVKKIVFISTVDVYQDKQEILTENTPAIPSTLYGWSKLYCENMVKAFCEKTGCIYEILRLGHVYGEGEEKYRKVMPIMIRNAVLGDNLKIYGDGEAIRSFIYIDDVAESIVRSLELTNSNTINIVGDEPITITQLANMIRSFSNHPLEIEYFPTDSKNKNYYFNNSRMREKLFDRLTPLEVGLRKEFEYMQRKISNENNF